MPLHPSGVRALKQAREEIDLLEMFSAEAEKRPDNRLAWRIDGRLEMHLIFDVPRELKDMMDEEYRKLLLRRQAEEAQSKAPREERYIDPKSHKMKRRASAKE